ncbi:MAG: PAS domain S-box protein [Burkholderiales bacterium]|nr:PAS domain S-box protein [Burkholderiales bacterium]
MSGPIGVASPWSVVPQLSNLLLVAYVVDAAVALWRRGDPVAHRRAAVVGGGIAGSMAMVAVFAALIVAGLVPAPTILTPGVFVIVLAVGYELGWDVINASALAAKLRASEAHFRQVVEAVPSAIVLVDAGGRIVLANAQAESTFGRSRGDLVGAHVESLVPARYRAVHERHRASYLADPRPRAMGSGRELHALRGDGSEIPVEVALNPMRTADGLFVLVSVVDLTERRRAERAAARQRDELAHLSRVAMLGELSGSLAHELNQPLTAILSNAQAAQRFLTRNPPEVGKVGEILTDIVKSDRRAGMVIQRLRSFLKKDESQREPLDVNELVQESLALMRSDLLNRHVSLRSELGHDLPAVSGDRVQLQQVLLNFVVNGCDAMDGRETDRELFVGTRGEPGGVVISVADRGAGIPPEDIERIFEPFMTTKAHGMGLGLAISKSIVEAHGGTLWAVNNPDRGATLHFRLPAA